MKKQFNLKFFLAFVPALFFTNLLLAQEKRALLHTDYDQWQSLSEIKMADNGEWVGYKVL